MVGSYAMAGEVKAFAGNSTPAGWLLCDGSAVSRTTYARLFEVIGTTYGAGNGSTTFNIPNLVDKFIEGAATSGTVKAAGLPNITGSFALRRAGDSSPMSAFNGAMSDGGYTGASGNSMVLASSQSENRQVLNFNASRSSSVYGNSNTVQPPALTMRYIIKF